MRFFVFFSSMITPHFCIVKQKLIQALMYKYILTSLFLLWTGIAGAQGWERVYGGSGGDAANGLALSPDGGYVMAGYYNGISRIYLLKTDADGDLQWTKFFTAPGNNNINAKAIIATQDSGYLVAGFVQVGFERNVYLLKIDAFGNKLWDRTIDIANEDQANAVIELAGGGFAVTGYSKGNDNNDDLFIIRTQADGSPQWTQTYNQSYMEGRGSAIFQEANGDLVVAGDIRQSNPSHRDFYVVRVNAGNGSLVWEQTYGLLDVNSVPGDEIAKGIATTDNGDYIVVGSTNANIGSGVLMRIPGNGNPNPLWNEAIPETDFNALTKGANGRYFAAGNKSFSPAVAELYVVAFDEDGNILWEPTVGRPGPDNAYAIMATPDGGCAAAGTSQPFVSPLGEEYAYLVKIDGLGQVYTSKLRGNLFHDFNLNCTQDAGEPALEDWIVKIQSEYNTVYAVSNNVGQFEFPVDTGDFQLVLFPPNNYWKACDSIVFVTVPSLYTTVDAYIPVQADLACPRNEVDIATPLLRRCTDNRYTVRYCNSGTLPSLNTRVEVTLDASLSITSSSAPFTALPNNVYEFNIGYLANGDCAAFTFDAFLDCTSTIAGQAHCVSAHIYPDDFCDPSSSWDESVVRAIAICDGDSVRMILQNVGVGNMTDPLGFVIAEDVIMLTQPGDPSYQFRIDAGQDSTVWTQAANGKTYRIIAEQSPGYPGESYPTAAVEGCQTDTSTTPISLGFYTMFPEDDADAFLSADCQESKEVDYNAPLFLKRGHPKGYDVPNYVSPETDLDYLIRFVNLESDTVQNIIVRDTLSVALDPATVYPGASSHNYDFTVYANGIVEFTLSNANLAPDSSANEGYVSFRVAQKDSLPCGTEILNRAAIYFDFNAPILSSQTRHTVCEFDSFVVVQTINILQPGATVKVFPNPFVDGATVQITGVDAKAYGFEIYDQQGKLLFNRVYTHPEFRIHRFQLPAGILFYRLTADGKPVASGKLVASH